MQDDLFSPMPAAAAAGTGHVGRSPDGLGVTATHVPQGPPGPRAQVVPTGNARGAGPGVGAELDWLEPDDVSPGAAIRSAGVTALAAAVAMGTGLAFGGGWGAGSGLLITGALFNGYRAQKWWGSPDASEKHEAVVSGVLAALGLGVGGWMAYRAYMSGKHGEAD